MRHIDTHILWLQQAVRNRRVELKKVLGEENPADLRTKHSLSRERVEKLTSLFDCYFAGDVQCQPPLFVPDRIPNKL